ncbi:hypothetical protein [Bdellovibrio sp. NC01]|uniref:hypothetical protein n=1 Tax=Bdellovibrio sp. NC01 TaxID=2220073 RepID=UPI00115B0912|nr:hypothetical protein [Bdellovibrio sp. NC01]QDK37379.1 hypothetical protein DOE51_07160 [Bdellovibrio sp. NC01]
MKTFKSLIAAIFIFSSIAQAEPQNCEDKLTKVTTTLLQQEGMNEINTCWGEGSSYNCQLVFSGCKAADTGARECYLRYIYGGAYYNYNDYTFKVGEQCEVYSLEIERL